MQWHTVECHCNWTHYHGFDCNWSPYHGLWIWSMEILNRCCRVALRFWFYEQFFIMSRLRQYQITVCWWVAGAAGCLSLGIDILSSVISGYITFLKLFNIIYLHDDAVLFSEFVKWDLIYLSVLLTAPTMVSAADVDDLWLVGPGTWKSV